jgi:hypothetical protein
VTTQLIIDHKREGHDMPEAKINWIRDYEEGVARVRNEKKPLYLDFFKDG